MPKKLHSSDGYIPVRDSEKRMRPRFDVPVSEIPVAKKWQVGSSYTLEVKVKQTALRESSFDDKMMVEFEIQSLKEK